MMTGYFRKIIFVVLLSVLLIPCAVRAQENGADRQVQTYSNEELAQMLAPIALYPDALLSQILMAAAYPFEVAEADRWVSSNPYVTGDDLDEALQAKDWDVSVLALCHYPKVLAMMSENLSWTAALGDAFTYQEEDVMDTVQELRNRAYEAGNLSTTDEQKVIVEERIVRIEPYSYDYFYGRLILTMCMGHGGCRCIRLCDFSARTFYFRTRYYLFAAHRNRFRRVRLEPLQLACPSCDHHGYIQNKKIQQALQQIPGQRAAPLETGHRQEIPA